MIHPHLPAQNLATFPGLTYTPNKMLERLIELSEGEVFPTKESLEQEFGLNFEKRTASSKGSVHSSLAKPPFFSPPSAPENAVSYLESQLGKTLILRFRGVNEPSTSQSFCIPIESMREKLKAKWKVQVRDSVNRTTIHTAVIGGISREIFEDPQGFGCMQSFSVRFIEN